MQRISNLLQKLTELSGKTGEPEIIDLDLMLDYTKVIYADLLEMRSRIAFNSSLTNTTPMSEVEEPSKNEATEQQQKTIDDIIKEPEEAIVAPTVEQTETIASAIVATAPSADTDIRRLISINDKYQFISELFEGNTNAYEDVLTQMNSFKTYPEAISWLDEVHSENNWNDDNDTVVSFYNIINHYFASK